MSDTERVTLTLQQLEDYRCSLDFGDGQPPLIVDEVLTRRDRLHSFKERREWRFS